VAHQRREGKRKIGKKNALTKPGKSPALSLYAWCRSAGPGCGCGMSSFGGGGAEAGRKKTVLSSRGRNPGKYRETQPRREQLANQPSARDATSTAEKGGAGTSLRRHRTWADEKSGTLGAFLLIAGSIRSCSPEEKRALCRHTAGKKKKSALPARGRGKKPHLLRKPKNVSLTINDGPWALKEKKRL